MARRKLSPFAPGMALVIYAVDLSRLSMRGGVIDATRPTVERFRCTIVAQWLPLVSRVVVDLERGPVRVCLGEVKTTSVPPSEPMQSPRLRRQRVAVWMRSRVESVLARAESLAAIRLAVGDVS